MDRPDDPAVATNGEGRRIHVNGLSKRYGALDAVKDVGLDVWSGEILSLLGPNGAGKTTTIRMLMGILKPTAGSATIAGYDCFGERPNVMRHVGYLPDEPIFYDYLRGEELLDFVGEMHGLDRTETHRRVDALVTPLGLDDALGDYAVNYSKGMKKKLALACALLHEPSVLVLDEPTNGLDPFATRTVHRMLEERAEAGASVLFSTHLLDQAERLSHRVAILHEGRLASVGRLEDLRARLAPGGSLEQVFFAVAADAEHGDGASS